MSIKSFLINLLEDKPMTDTTNIPVSTPVAATPVADTTTSAEQSTAETTASTTEAATTTQSADATPTAEVAATPSVATVETDADSVTQVAENEATDTDKLKEALQVAGHDVSGYWDVAVAFGKKIDSDIAYGIKKALDYLGSEAVAVYDEALAIAKLKK